jgi:hypothetical protein
VQPFEGGEEVPLTRSSTVKMHTEWSPDERHIAFIEVEEEQDWLSVVTVSGGRVRQLGIAGTRTEGHRFSWTPTSDAIFFTTTDGQISRAVLDGPVEVLFPLPESSGILWDVLVSADGDSVATFSHLFSEGRFQYLIHSASIATGEWDLRLNGPGEVYDVNLIRAERRFPGGWRMQSPLYWYEDGRIEAGIGFNTGMTETTAIWSLEPSRNRRLVELTDPCGAPAMVTATRGNTHIACIRRGLLSDFWLMDGLQGGS